jgi:hypothetical protein
MVLGRKPYSIYILHFAIPAAGIGLDVRTSYQTKFIDWRRCYSVTFFADK